jgi:hypothetical protein
MYAGSSTQWPSSWTKILRQYSSSTDISVDPQDGQVFIAFPLL